MTPKKVALPPDMMLLVEAAQRTGLHATTLHRQSKRGRLPTMKIGRDTWVRWRDVQTYLDTRKHSGRYRADVG